MRQAFQFENRAGLLVWLFVQVFAALFAGACIGFVLGLAYAAHLYGTPPVVIHLQNWLAGDSLYFGPLPVDLSDHAGRLSGTAVVLLPQTGACLGFAVTISVLFSIFFNQALKNAGMKRDGSK